MSRVPVSTTAFQESQSGYENEEGSCENDAEQLAMGVSEMVLGSPTEKKTTPLPAATAVPAAISLSAEAPEFVPSWMKTEAATTPAMLPTSAAMNIYHDISTDTNQFTNGPTQGELSASEISQYLLSDVKMYVSVLQESPESYSEMALTILDLLTNFAFSNELLAAAVDQIFSAGLNSNFSYQCARLCSYLADNYWGYGGTCLPEGANPDQPDTSFRDLLIRRCHQEHINRLAGPLPCLYNYGLLLADLYNQLKVVDQRPAVLGEAVLEVASALLREPNNGNVAGAVSILKCCGATLERADAVVGAQSPSKLDAVFSQFEILLQSDTTNLGLSEDGKMLIRNLMKSRVEWKQYANQAGGDGYQQEAPSYNPISSDTVYFGPDGKALTAEEAAFLETELGPFQSSSSGDEEAALQEVHSSEDDAIDDAYEEFLKMTEAKKKQSQQ